MSDEDRDRLRRVLAAFDEPALVALANKGLVCRAQKDLEAGGLSHEETENAVLVHGPDWVVTMPPDGPARATDTTKATGVTRQILTATLYLRDKWPATAPAAVEAPGEVLATPEADAAALEKTLLAADMDDLEKWAGKTTLREALAAVRAGAEVEVERGAGLTLRLVRHEVEARLMPGTSTKSVRALLDQVLTTAPKAQHKRWVAAAVLAFWKSHGRGIELTETDTAPADEAGAVLGREEVVAAARALAEAMVRTGLAHPSTRTRERLLTLSVSATAVHVPRLARLTRALADEVALVLARDAAADTARLFDLAAFVHALTRALAAAGPQPPVALCGRHRTQYDPAGDLDLAGVGAYPWRTASGFEGVTVLFWEPAGRRFLTWTASRPVGQISLARAYAGDSVWAGAGPPEHFSRARLKLRQARLNPAGRLSASQSTAAEAAEATDPASLDFGGRAFADWTALFEYARSVYPIGLRERDPSDRLVVLRAAHWGARTFDEVQQRFVWVLHDAGGRAVVLTLPWVGVNETSVEFLEAVNPDRDRLDAVVARLDFSGRGVRLEPLALLGRGTPAGDRVLNPGFDRARIVSKQSNLLERLRKKFGRDRIPTTLTADEDDVPGWPEASADGDVPGIGSRLREAESVLLRMAEAGLGRLDPAAAARLRRLAADLDRSGLQEMSAAFGELAAGGAPAADVLHCGYLARLHRAAAALQWGT